MATLGNSPTHIFDAIVLGAGPLGSTLACKLAADGYRVCLCDDSPAPPPSFRTEHLPQPAVALYRELGMFPRIKPLLTPLDYTAHFRNGRQYQITAEEDYAVSSDRLVRTLRHGLERVAALYWEPVVRVSPSGRVKSVRLQSGTVLCSWMVALAAEGGGAWQAFPGLREEVVCQEHSLNFAWNMELQEPARMSHPALVFRTSRGRHGIDHLRIFRHGEHLRANLFTFWHAGDERRGSLLRGQALPALGGTLEGLFDHLGPLRVTSPVEEQTASLTRVHGGPDAGVVLVGDACGQVAPIAGMGLCKGLHDVKILASLAPGWLRERQITAEVLATYYGHPAKREVDERYLSQSMSARKAAIERNPEWLARRLKGDLPEWLETACQRGLEGGRWTLENVGLPAWRKGVQLVQSCRTGRGKREAASGGILTARHDDLAGADRFDDLVS